MFNIIRVAIYYAHSIVKLVNVTLQYKAKSMWTSFLIIDLRHFSHTYFYQVHKLKQISRQSPWTQIGSRMGGTEELSGFKHCTLNKAVYFSALLDLPWSSINAITVKWKCPRATVAQS